MDLRSEKISLDDSLEAVNDWFYDQGWTDGLPIIPPTPDLVSEFLDTAGRGPSDILGTEPTKGRVITAEKVAVNSVMAGCKPEYLPVVITADQQDIGVVTKPRLLRGIQGGKE